MPETVIEVGGKPVFASGSIMTASYHPIKIWPFGKGAHPFIQFVFRIEDRGTNLAGNPEGQDGFTLSLPNPEDQGFSNTAPFHVFSLNSKRVLLDFCVQRVGSAPPSHIITYSIYDGGIGDE